MRLMGRLDEAVYLGAHEIGGIIMEDSVRMRSGILHSAGRVGLVRATLATGAALLLGFIAYSTFIVFVPHSPSYDGVLVSQVESGSPASIAGVRPGDVITRVDDVKVNRHQLSEAVLSSLGRTMTWNVNRDGSTVALYVQPLAQPGPNQPAVGIDVRNVFKGRKATVLAILPVAFVGAGLVIAGSLIGLRRKQTGRRRTATSF